ncbi:MAG: hypothetical protein ACTS5A_01595 [Candidatus Hodgkinia cicadicola]
MSLRRDFTPNKEDHEVVKRRGPTFHNDKRFGTRRKVKLRRMREEISEMSVGVWAVFARLRPNPAATARKEERRKLVNLEMFAPKVWALLAMNLFGGPPIMIRTWRSARWKEVDWSAEGLKPKLTLGLNPLRRRGKIGKLFGGKMKSLVKFSYF